MAMQSSGHFDMVDGKDIPDESDKLSLTDSNTQVYSYIVMSRHGPNLSTLFQERAGNFTGE